MKNRPAANLFHVDVFAADSLGGNGLSVFLHADGWSASHMQQLTQEMKQFESIFLSGISATGASARVFTVEEELPFAGHPVLGAAAVLHRTQAPESTARHWTLKLAHGPIRVKTRKLGRHYSAEMDQGIANAGRTLSARELQPFLGRLGLMPDDLVAELPARVISTGLPYLIVPVHEHALARAAICCTDLESELATVGARFILVLDPARRELRTWDNLGKVEDVATGSAAGPAGAYLFDAGLADPDEPLLLSQGRFAGRASVLQVEREQAGRLLVSGQVWPVSSGVLEVDLTRC